MGSGVFKLYEQHALQKVTGDSLHPGGMKLTEHAFELCPLPQNARIMDVACGIGASIQWLNDNKSYTTFGIDASELMLKTGRQRNPGVHLVCGKSQMLPIASDQLEAILIECSLSLMPEFIGVIEEFYRVLRPSGYLIMSDLYLRNPQNAELLRKFPLDFCLKGAKSQQELTEILYNHGFKIVIWEDHSESLKQLTGQLIMTHGSMQEFWCQSMPGEIDTFELQVAIARTKPGYFLLIAKKDDNKFSYMASRKNRIT